MIRCGVLSYVSLLSSQVCGVLQLLIPGSGVHDTMWCAELRVTVSSLTCASIRSNSVCWGNPERPIGLI
jgi:hypothetical protein